MPSPPASGLRVANIAESSTPGWRWILDKVARPLDISAFSTRPAPSSGPGSASLARLKGGLALRSAHTRTPFDLIISHAPWPASWSAATLAGAKGDAKTLLFGLNFTDLPTGPRKALMAQAFRTFDSLVVFTDHEKDLYARYFNLPAERILRAPWGVRAPLSTPLPRAVDGPYLAALGGEARDYQVLCDAAKLTPELTYVAIARPEGFAGIDAPANMKVFFNLPADEAWSYVAHADAAIIPLRSRETPCGLVTLVGGMHLGKAQIATRAAGVAEYIEDGATGLLVPEHDAAALAAAARRLSAHPDEARRLGYAASKFAAAHLTETATIAFFETLLTDWFGAPPTMSARTPG